MTDLRKAAEQALRQLQKDDVYLGHRSKTRADAIKALGQALAQPEQEPNKRSIAEDVGRLLNTGKGFYDDGTPIEPKEIQMKIEGVGDGAVVCTEVHLPRPPKREWVGLNDDEREHFRKLGFVGVLAVENKLKEKNT